MFDAYPQPTVDAFVQFLLEKMSCPPDHILTCLFDFPTMVARYRKRNEVEEVQEEQ